MKRRAFIRNGSALAATALLHLRLKAASFSGSENIGIQLYTLRAEMEKSPESTLRALAQMGYAHVEHTGYYEGKYYGLEPKAFKTLLNDNGLEMYSGHTHTGKSNPHERNTMSNQWESVCADAAEMGQKYLVCGYLSDFERKSLDDYKMAADLFNRCGRKAEEYGLHFLYHNHDFEFNPIERVLPYDVLLAETDPRYVQFEMDLFWTRKGGVEGLHYFKNHPGRFPLWHIKDMDDSADQHFTEVGSGVIDWKKYFAKRDEAGLQYFYVEQDVCKNFHPLESVRISIDYLNKIV